MTLGPSGKPPVPPPPRKRDDNKVVPPPPVGSGRGFAFDTTRVPALPRWITKKDISKSKPDHAPVGVPVGVPVPVKKVRTPEDLAAEERERKAKQLKVAASTFVAVGVAAVVAGNYLWDDFKKIFKFFNPDGTAVSEPIKPVTPMAEAEYLAFLDLVTTTIKSPEGKQKLAIFDENLNSKSFCRFSDEWYKGNKPLIRALWEYVDENSANLSPEVVSLKKRMFEISQIIKSRAQQEGSPNPFDREKVTKFGIGIMVPSSPGGIEQKLGAALKKPAEEGTSCGMTFDIIFKLLEDGNQVPELQKLMENFIVGVAALLKENLKKLGGDKAREIELTKMLGKLIYLAEPK
jgi:hypothetical protein